MRFRQLVKVMYDASQCAMVDSAGQPDWFDVKSGVKQGANVSEVLSILYLESSFLTVGLLCRLDETNDPRKYRFRINFDWFERQYKWPEVKYQQHGFTFYAMKFSDDSLSFQWSRD